MRDGGRSRSDPRVSAPRAFLLSRRDLPAPSSRAALQRRARAWYSGRGRGSGRGLRRPRGRKRRGGKRCVFVLFLLPFRSPLPLFHFVSFVFPTNVTAVTLPHPQPTPGCAHALPSPSFLAQLLTSGQRQPPPPAFPSTRRCPSHGRCRFVNPMPRYVFLAVAAVAAVACFTPTSRPALQQSFGTSVCVCSLD